MVHWRISLHIVYVQGSMRYRIHDNAKVLRKCLDMVEYYRKSVWEFFLLTSLSKKKAKFLWTSKSQEGFDKI